MAIDKLLQKHINTELCFHLNAFVENPRDSKYVHNCRSSNQTFLEYDTYDEMDQCQNQTLSDDQANFDIRCG